MRAKSIKVIFVLIVVFPIFSISPDKMAYQDLLSIERNDGTGNTDKENIIMKSADSEFLLEPLLSNITNVTIHQGINLTGDLDSLKWVDEDKYLIAPNFSAGKYKFDVRFQFPVDLETYHLTFYDLFLYLDIDAPDFENELVYFQVNQSYEWKTIITINTNETHIERLFVENCCEFRLYAEIDIIKLISIDRIRFLLGHTGTIDALMYLGNVGYSIASHSEGSGPYGYFVDDPNWWVYYPDDDYILQYGNEDGDEWATTFLTIDMNLDDSHLVKFVDCSDLSIYFMVSFSPIAPCDLRRVDLRIYNYKSSSWDYLKRFNFEALGIYYGNFTINWAPDINISIDSYINENYQWRFRLDTDIWYTSSCNNSQIVVLHNCTANVTAIPYHDYYPTINLSSTPSSPISSLGAFNISASVSANYSKTITSVKYCMFNTSWSSGWNDMDPDAGDEYYKELDTKNLALGNYTVLVNATDSAGLSTYDFLDLELKNNRPAIQFINLNADINPIGKLNDFEIQVLVNDPEDDACDEVSLMFYNATNHAQFATWQDMTFIEALGCYSYIFNPIDFPVGIYTVIIRAADAKGYGFNSTTIVMPTRFMTDQIPLLLWGILSTAALGALIGYVIITKKKDKARLKQKPVVKKAPISKPSAKEASINKPPTKKKMQK